MFTGLVQRIFIYDNIEDATLKPGTHYPHSQAVNAGHKHSVYRALLEITCTCTSYTNW